MLLTLGRSRRWRIPIHYSWRWKHNIWPRWWCIRITVGIRGRGIVPRISARRWWIRRTRKRLWRVLGKCRRVGGLFSPGGSRFFLVTAHEMIPSGAEVVLGWRGKSAAKRLRRTSCAMLVEPRKMGEKEKEKEKRDGVPRLWSFGILRSRRRSDSSWRWCSASISRERVFHDRTSSM